MFFGCFVVRGHVVHPSELGGAKDHRSKLFVVCFLRRTHLGFLEFLCQFRGQWQGTARKDPRDGEAFHMDESQGGDSKKRDDVDKAPQLCYASVGNCVFICCFSFSFADLFLFMCSWF